MKAKKTSEYVACEEAALASASRGVKPAEAWEEHWDKAYALAEVAIENIVTRWVGRTDAFAESTTWRSQPASKL